ncbi:MAG: hypothetical protein HY549_09560 [Elusimicrobia bacterium]|nr:hypothetical protein [Elusimicrobiota bacterium]
MRRFQGGKVAFWAFTATVLALSSVPSALFVDGLAKYRRFIDQFDMDILRQNRVAFVPHRGRAESDSQRGEKASHLDFAEFRLKAPKAEKVFLLGDFNGWRPDTLALSRQAGGVWEILLPLPAGKYRYAYLVDGQRLPDPENPVSEDWEGQRVSLREVSP